MCKMQTEISCACAPFSLTVLRVYPDIYISMLDSVRSHILYVWKQIQFLTKHCSCIPYMCFKFIAKFFVSLNTYIRTYTLGIFPFSFIYLFIIFSFFFFGSYTLLFFKHKLSVYFYLFSLKVMLCYRQRFS